MPIPNEEVQKLVGDAMQAALQEVQAGRAEQAAALYRAVLDLLPGHAQAHFGLGQLEHQAGDAGAAIPHFASALQAAPEEESHWLAYLEALMEARQFSTARELIELGRRHGLQGPEVEALAQRLDASGEPEAEEVDAAATLYAQGRLDAAGDAARALTERFPQHGFGWKLLGAVQYKKRDLSNAMESMRRAVTYAPDDAETLCNFGLLLKRSSQFEEARSILEQSIALRPDSARTHNYLAGTLADTGLLDEALAEANIALALDPELLDTWQTLAVILEKQGKTEEAITAYRHVLAHNPDQLDSYGNLLFCLSHNEDISPAELFAEHRQFGQRLEAKAPAARAWDNPPEPGRPLRIGFVSGDLRHHAVASFIAPVFESLGGRPGLELHAYYNHPSHDHVTTRLRGLVPHWRDVAELDDVATDRLIRADAIDILVDLSGPTGYNRLPLFARKPAPLQVTWIGYPGTTGLATMDYLFTDRHVAPPGLLDAQFTEKLVRLPLAGVFTPSPHAPDPVPLPALRNGYLTFGSFNRLTKFSRKVIAVWGQLLRALPDAKLVMAGMPEDGTGHALLGDWLQEEGIDPARVRFHPRTGMGDYLAMHNEIDLCLDTFPYSGGTTTFHALHMGVPTLTIAGRTMAGRQTVCILEHNGLGRFIADDAEDFVRKGIAASQDLAGLATLRAGLRGSSPLSAADAVPRLADALENAFRMMWERWCAGLPPISFDAPSVRTQDSTPH